MNVGSTVASWLKGLRLLYDDECEGPTGDSSLVTLSQSATAYFANGVRVALLLRALSHDGELSLDTIKELHTPVARLYNWNVLIPILHAMGVDVDADMKVLIVAGDLDIVADVLEQLHGSGSGSGAAKRQGNQGMQQPRAAKETTSVAQFLAFCCTEQLGVSWEQAIELVRAPGHKALAKQQGLGVRGEHSAAVRWFKLVFAHCKHLGALCAGDASEAELALSAMRGGLGSFSPDVVLWCSRLLCRLAADLAHRGTQADTLWAFFSRPNGGAAMLLDAWRMHAELRPDGVLLPLVLHFSGEHLDRFFTHVLPRHLPAPGAYWSFTLELLPLLAGSDGTRGFLAQSGTLRFLLQRALEVCRTMSAPATRGLALEALATLWSLFAREMQELSLTDIDEAEIASSLEALRQSEGGGMGGMAGGIESHEGAAAGKEATSVVLGELKRACRDPEFELQLTAHMQLFRLLDQFAAMTHPVAPILFKVLAFSLIENHHEPVLRQFLVRNMQHTLQQQPFIPVGVLLKPLVKQAILAPTS